MSTWYTLIATFIIATSAHAGSFVQAIPSGSYKGQKRAQDSGSIHMLVESYAGCDGCFIAILIDKPEPGHREVALAAYSVFPRNRVDIGGGRFSATRYGMVPMGTSPRLSDEEIEKLKKKGKKVEEDDGYDGDLTLPNANPSMVIDIALKDIGTEDVKFKITSAQSGNFRGITTTMDFLKSKESPMEMWEPAAGDYRDFGKSKKSATISMVKRNEADDARSANINWNGTLRISGGDFLLREKAPNVYTFNSIQYLAYGEKVKNLPTFIVVFVKDRGLFGSKKRMVLMVHPFQETNVHAMVYMGDDT